MRNLSIIMFATLALGGCAQPTQVEVDNAWARDSAGRTATSAVFMTITADAPDRLIGASTPAAGKADLMTMEMNEGAMAMSYVDSIDIPANSPVSLDPAGLHVWLEDLSAPLKGGTSFPLTLKFEEGGEKQVVVTVIEPAAAPPEAAMEM